MILRPQRAILRDGLREATASWSLWVSLALCTLALILIAPLSFTRELTTSIVPERPDMLLDPLAAALADQPTSPVAERIVAELDGSARAAIATYAEEIRKIPPGRPVLETFPIRINAAESAMRTLRGPLEQLVTGPDFYDAETFRTVGLDRATRELVRVPAAKRTSEQTARQGRLLLENAFPEAYRRSPPESYALSYLGYEFTPAIPMTQVSFEQSVRDYASLGMYWIVGTLGILAALLVTAPIMPQTFDPNSLLLLLSKPVSRVSLYLSQFTGGLAFVVVLASYVIVGLTLILGVRFGIWLPGLLWWVPAFTFIFAIFYSVSALVGVVSRSTILAVGASAVLWAVCTGLGIFQSVSQLAGIDARAVYEIEPAGDAILARQGNSFWARATRFDPAASQWRSIDLTPPGGQQQNPFGAMVRLGPVYDPTHRVAAVQLGFGPAGDQQLTLITPELDFQRRPGPSLPGSPEMIVSASGDRPANDGDEAGLVLITPTSVGLQRGRLGLEPPKAASATPALPTIPGLNLNPFRLFSGSKPSAEEPKPSADLAPYVDWTPETWPFRDQASTAYHGASRLLALVTDGELILYTRAREGRYQQAVSARLTDAGEGLSAVSIGGPGDRPVVAVALEDGTITVFRVTLTDAEEGPPSAALDQAASLRPAGSTMPNTVTVSPDGRTTAVLFSNRKVYTVRTEDGTASAPWLMWQGTFTAIRFWDDGTLAIADRSGGITWYDVTTWAQTDALVPKTTFFFWLYYYVVEPAYLLLPKPGELDRTVTYLMTGDATRKPNAWEQVLSGAIPQGTSLTTEARVLLQPWRPVWSGALFLVVMLGAGSIYMWRKEF